MVIPGQDLRQRDLTHLLFGVLLYFSVAVRQNQLDIDPDAAGRIGVSVLVELTMQCARPCHDTLYPTLELAGKMAAAEQGGKVPLELVPRCPKCGGPMEVHMEGGHGFIPDTVAQQRMQLFLHRYHGKKLVVLELGVGWRNQLIKAPLMRLVAREPDAVYVTVNLGKSILRRISKSGHLDWMVL